jgi:hypothetical protein
MLPAFTRGTVLLLNDDVLPTADASTECFEENLLPNGALLPNSAHMSVSSLYQFLVLIVSNYGNGDMSLLFSVEIQALVSSRCSPDTSSNTSSLNNITSKLYLVPRRGWAQRMEMLPALRENSPSSKHLQGQSSAIWWTNTR